MNRQCTRLYRKRHLITLPDLDIEVTGNWRLTGGLRGQQNL